MRTLEEAKEMWENDPRAQYYKMHDEAAKLEQEFLELPRYKKAWWWVKLQCHRIAGYFT